MRQTAALLVLFAAVSSAAPAQRALTPRVTDKPVDSFAQCFVAAQQQASAAWSYIPKEDGGGTFSNAGATAFAILICLKLRTAVRRGKSASPRETARSC